MNEQQPQTNVKITDEMLGGVYSNMMQIAHTKTEFVLDFMCIFPPTGKLVSRIIIAPEHAKQILLALAQNIQNYDKTFNTLPEQPQEETTDGN